MKLYESLPGSVIVNGRKIKLDLDFRNVLRMMDILQTDDLTSEAREWLALRCICRHPRKGMLEAVKNLLFVPGEHKARERVMDFVQDADLIRAAFEQAYGIDLTKDRIHWLRFLYLLSGLPENTRLSEVISIRSRPIPEPTKYNQKEIQSLIEAKAAVALRMSEEERMSRYRRDVMGVAALLINMAEGSGADG